MPVTIYKTEIGYWIFHCSNYILICLSTLLLVEVCLLIYLCLDQFHFPNFLGSFHRDSIFHKKNLPQHTLFFCLPICCIFLQDSSGLVPKVNMLLSQTSCTKDEFFWIYRDRKHPIYPCDQEFPHSVRCLLRGGENKFLLFWRFILHCFLMILHRCLWSN